MPDPKAAAMASGVNSVLEPADRRPAAELTGYINAVHTNTFFVTDVEGGRYIHVWRTVCESVVACEQLEVS